MVALFFAGQPPAKAALVAGALLLLTRRIKSATKVYAEIDWPLLLMFAGLFIVVAGARQALLTPDWSLPSARCTRPDAGAEPS